MAKRHPWITKTIYLVSGIVIIYAALWGGRLFSGWLIELTGIKVPASILGMLLLAGVLQSGWIKLIWVRETSNLFIRWMSLLFVPVGVSLVDNLDELYDSMPAMLLTCVVATMVLLTLVGWAYQLLERLR